METPIITGVFDDDVFGRNIVPQIHDAPPHRKLRMRTVQGPLLLRIADDATPDLVEISSRAPVGTGFFGSVAWIRTFQSTDSSKRKGLSWN